MLKRLSLLVGLCWAGMAESNCRTGRVGQEMEQQHDDTATGGAIVSSTSLHHQAGENDVLFGRGKGAYNHQGNVRFRALVLERVVSYKLNENRAFRKALAREIIQQVKARGGKFLRPARLKPSCSGESSASSCRLDSVPDPLLCRLDSVPDPLVLNKVKQALRHMSVAILQEPKPKITTAPPTNTLPRPESQLFEPILSDPFSEAPFSGRPKGLEQQQPLSQLDYGWILLAQQQQQQQATQQLLLSSLGQQLVFQSIQQQLSGFLLPTTGHALGQHMLLQQQQQQQQQQHCMGGNSLSQPPSGFADPLLSNGTDSRPLSQPVSLLPTAPPSPAAGYLVYTIEQAPPSLPSPPPTTSLFEEDECITYGMITAKGICMYNGTPRMRFLIS